VIENASEDYPDHEIARAIAAIAKETEEGVLTNHSKVTIVAKRRSAHNYGHFLMECLPMAFIARQLLSELDGELQYMIQRVPSPMQDVMYRAFRLLDVNLDNVLVQGFREPLHFEHLLVVRGISKHGEYMSPLSIQAAETMAGRQFDRGTMPGRRCEKIFVRRVPALGRGRELLNENEVAQRLSAAGFLAIEPGTMTLEEQIMTFSGANQIVGVCGAAMANIAFCRPGATATLLFPAMFPDEFFWFIATHKGMNYVEIRGRQATYDPPNSWEGGFWLDEKDIQYLETL
jgi:capsular polysaccharide biosynthesis protein